MSVLRRTRAVLGWAQGSATQLPTAATIAADHVLDEETPAQPFRRDEHYFQVRVNELFLATARQWFARFDPMVLVVSEFIYDKRPQAVPFVVGPSMLEKYGQQLPAGMILSDTRVAGPHPYKGGRLSLAVVLSQVQKVNYAQELLKVVESAAGLSFATGLGAYLPVAGILLDGVDALLGLEAVTPLMGFRKEFDPDAGDDFVPSWLALVDVPEGELDPAQLWVRGGRLLEGPDPDDLHPFRRADFVLYSIRQQDETRELEILPFYPLWERVEDAAMKAGKESGDRNWESARSDMRSLAQTMERSPDLTEKQADTLTDMYIKRAQALRERTGKIEGMDAEELSADEQQVQRIRGNLASILAD
jgi:hypothetical protein